MTITPNDNGRRVQQERENRQRGRPAWPGELWSVRCPGGGHILKVDEIGDGRVLACVTPGCAFHGLHFEPPTVLLSLADGETKPPPGDIGHGLALPHETPEREPPAAGLPPPQPGVPMVPVFAKTTDGQPLSPERAAELAEHLKGGTADRVRPDDVATCLLCGSVEFDQLADGIRCRKCGQKTTWQQATPAAEADRAPRHYDAEASPRCKLCDAGTVHDFCIPYDETPAADASAEGGAKQCPHGNRPDVCGRCAALSAESVARYNQQGKRCNDGTTGQFRD